MDGINLKRDIKKARKKLNYLIRINGYNLLDRDILICSRKLDWLVIKYQGLNKKRYQNNKAIL